MSFYGPGGWGWGGGGWQPGPGYGQPGFGGRGPGGGGFGPPQPQPGNPANPGNQPPTAQPLPASQDPNSPFYGTPFPPDVWPVGQFATTGKDAPILITFAVIFFIAMVFHFASMFINAAKGNKVLASLLLFMFCAARVASLSTRAAGAYLGYNGDLYIAGFVMTFAAPPLLYFVNLVFAHRVIRLQHPIIGRWNPILYVFFIIIYIIMLLTWGFLLAGLVQPFYYRQPRIRNIDRNFRKYAVIIFAITAGLPIVLVIISSLIPRIRRHKRYSHVGMAIKIIVLLIASTLTAGEAIFLAIVEWKPQVSRNDPAPKWTGRIFYYIFIFVLEILVVYLYIISRVDQRIHGARYDDDQHTRQRESRATNRSRSSSEFATGAAEKPPKARMFGLLPPKSNDYDSYPRDQPRYSSDDDRSRRSESRDRNQSRERSQSRGHDRDADNHKPKKEGAFAKFRKYGLTLTGGAAAGAATAGAVQHRRRSKRRNRSRSPNRRKSVAWVDELDKQEAINRDPGYDGRHHQNETFTVPRKELRPYDTETITEESEYDDSSDSLFAPGSSIRTDDKPMSPASTLVEEREPPRPRSAMRDIGQRAEMRDRSSGRRSSL